MALDRRVQRTRELLRESLMELILEKGYDAITVQEITDRANLGRATFYLHYNDKEDLLFSTLQDTVEELKQLVKTGKHEARLDAEWPNVLAFEHAAEHADFYRVLLSGQGATNLLSQLRSYITSVIEEVIITSMPTSKESRIPLEVVSNYFSGALLMMIEWWLRNDMPYSPTEMARMFRELTRFGLWSAFDDSVLPLSAAESASHDAATT
jgi:AcrR family transcriptional regulator